MNKNSLHKTKYDFIADKDSIKKTKTKTKQNIELLLKENTLIAASGRYRFIYTISVICVVLLDLIEYSLNNQIYFYHSYRKTNQIFSIQLS